MQRALESGFDLYQGLVVGPGVVGQWVAEGEAAHEYQLVCRNELSYLHNIVDGMTADGWDLYMGTVHFCGWYLQWMCREKTVISKSATPSANAVVISNSMLEFRDVPVTS